MRRAVFADPEFALPWRAFAVAHNCICNAFVGRFADCLHNFIRSFVVQGLRASGFSQVALRCVALR